MSNPFEAVQIISRESNLESATHWQRLAAYDSSMARCAFVHYSDRDISIQQRVAAMSYREARRIMIGAEHDIDPATCEAY